MRQIVNNLRSGVIELIETPRPNCKKGHLLIQSQNSLISSGTERMVVEFGRANILSKAQSRPDKVAEVLNKLKTDGLLPTMEAVFSRLEEPIPLGYCNAGVVIEVGEGVTAFSVGDRVISNGHHAEIVCVPENLCAKIPDGVSYQEAAFTVLASIAMQGIRLAEPSLGERVAVLGLGLIGLITVQILKANGCQVIGADFDTNKLSLAGKFGAKTIDLGAGEDPIQAGMMFSNYQGIDKVIITAATESNDPVHQAAQMSRKRGKIILVGVTGLDLKREDFYQKELTFQVSCSYGPGRYDPAYEEKGQDYPLGFVRWTEQRNFQAVLELIRDRKLEVGPMISKVYPFDSAPAAYNLLLDDSSQLGIVLEYPKNGDFSPTVQIIDHPLKDEQQARTDTPVIGMIGAGLFASRVLIPALKKEGASLHTLVSAGGLSAAVSGRKFGFAQASTDLEEVYGNQDINTVVIATRHDLHADLVMRGLQAGKHIFVEKPLALNQDQLAAIKQAREKYPGSRLMVGYNRRFSALALTLKKLLDSRTQPLAIIYTVNPGLIPGDHWTQDPDVGGGRIIGEACHMIDLTRYLVGTTITEVNARMLGGSSSVIQREDKMTITLGFADGSLGTIHYLANGSKSFPKERLEVFSEGRVLQLDNFRSLQSYGWPGFTSRRLWRQDKGHQNELKAFLKGIRSGDPDLISWDELVEVSQASFKAMEGARDSGSSSGPIGSV